MKPSKVEKIICFLIVKLVCNFRPRWATKIQVHFFRRWGMKFNEKPNYISSKVWMDGTDYSLISIGKEVTISSYVRVLTHDWSLHTIAKAFDIEQKSPLGSIKGVKIGDYSFIGTGSIIMPGAKIGKCCIIGSGTVVRGEIPDYSICIGSPCEIIGNSKDYLDKKLSKY
ncbi:acyltransferase [Vibrio campbellii]|uniref:acyltransferase n=1 Tax=Vibrio campbellii TaxID=680 RepID=UPI0038CD99ED